MQSSELNEIKDLLSTMENTIKPEPKSEHTPVEVMLDKDILCQIQSELKAPKGQRNNFGNYNYRSAEDILEAVKPLLRKHKACLICNDEVVEVGGRVYVKTTALLATGTTPVASSTAFAREPLTKKGMDEAQITGATASYAKKYALNSLFAIDDTKDADFSNTHGKPAKQSQATSVATIETELI
tara:strand:- start:266 stop:817 length:552 start_codon:yes stop_codon:yes gene_type:complete